ncbi:MAG TPA: hypothetical protein VID48_13625 [Solirubrobacteraceae bacterium]
MSTAPSNPQRTHRYARESTEQKTPPESARQLLVGWANEQDGWVRELVGEVLTRREVIKDEGLERVFTRFLAENKLSEEEAQTVPWIERGAEADQWEAELKLNVLSDVQSVNALAGSQTIEFNPSLTVFFGENGSGKTGYTRILKRLSGSRTVAPILPNVYKPGNGNWPQVKISYALAGEQRVLEWTNNEPVAELTRIAVFDDGAVKVHLDGDLSYLYTPGDLVLFPGVAASINQVRSRIEQEIVKRRPPSGRFTGRFTPGTQVFKIVQELEGHTDSLALTDSLELVQLATISAQEAASLEPLATRVQALQAQTLPAQLTVEQLRRDHYKRLIASAAKVIAFDWEAYNNAIADAKDAEERYRQLAGRLFSQAGIQGADAEVWKSFLLAGETYREHVAGESYPSEGDVCLYCRQGLGEQALALLRSYHEFANDEQRRRFADARARAAALSREPLSVDRVRLGEELASQRGDGSAAAAIQSTIDMLTALETQQGAILAGESVQWTELYGFALLVTRECKAALQASEKLIGDLSSKAEKRLQALELAKAQYAQLKDRIELASCFNDVTAHVQDARWVARAQELASRFGALQRSFTQIAKAAGEQFINGDFSKRFAEECLTLSAPSVRLEFPGRQGRTARHKTIANKQKLSAVLSQGEQRLIALADFLAEALMRPSGAPLVFDDPSSGLDRSHAGALADRLARLCGERQVIVFTHDIWFVGELLGRLNHDRARYTHYQITDTPETGVVHPVGDQEPPDGLYAMAAAQVPPVQG